MMKFGLFKICSRFYRTAYTRYHGIGVLREPNLNKGTAFEISERQLLGIHGLLPPAVINLELQSKKMLKTLQSFGDDLQRYIFLIGLQDRNETLFYKVVSDYIEYVMPFIYTPTVGLACQRYGLVFRRPRGLYITIHDSDYISEILENWPEPIVKAIVVTDGERILGLGDLGAFGMGIPVGKLSLYTGLAGVLPKYCLPVLLDVGTNTESLLKDPSYIGIREKRINDERYDKFVDNFMKAIVKKYGYECLIQFEDFANHNAFRMLKKYSKDYCTFNDDIQGTAAVAVAGLMTATRLTGRKLADDTFLFVGAGEASTGIADLLKSSMVIEGCPEKEAISKIYMTDKDGLLVKSRQKGNIYDYNEIYADKDLPEMDNLEEIVEKIKPMVIIGASGVGGLFTKRILKTLAATVDVPIIFALSNPTNKAECTAEAAYTMTQGKCIFASGSPFGKVSVNVGCEEKSFQPGQCNNSYIFPGVGLAITACKIRPVCKEIFVKAAEALSFLTADSDLALGRVFPPYSDIRKVSLAIALSVSEYAYSIGVAHHMPKPHNLEEYLAQQMYTPSYYPLLPTLYDWPCGASGGSTGPTKL